MSDLRELQLEAQIEKLEAEVTMLRSTWTPPEDDEPPEEEKYPLLSEKSTYPQG